MICKKNRTKTKNFQSFVKTQKQKQKRICKENKKRRKTKQNKEFQ
jgi:hypothetical protein